MKKLNRALERFAYSHPRFGIPNLMRFVVGGQVLVYLLYMFTGYSYSAIEFLEFHLSGLLHGEIWRLVSFVFLPNSYRPFTFIILLSFYYFVGNMLEREWGTAKFTLYYLCGIVLSVAGTVIASLITGNHFLTISSAYYLNLTIFLAFAVLYPDAQIMFYMIIPLKAKWLAIADIALFAWGVVQSLFYGNIAGAVIPLVALANFVLFFWTEITEKWGFYRNRSRHRNSHQTIQFKKAAEQQQRKAREQGFRHKCSVCGRTDADFPDLQFRYCSKCAGYHCFCEEHIFDHIHFTD